MCDEINEQEESLCAGNVEESLCTSNVEEKLETNLDLGRRGEDAAVAYLERQGFEIIERNWRCKFGEADIIAFDIDGSLVFVEVKTRRSLEAGMPEEAITKEKQRRYERIAMSYLIMSDWDGEVALRFDVIGICVTSKDRALLRHHRSCFDACC